jgi:hypothetical protein
MEVVNPVAAERVLIGAHKCFCAEWATISENGALPTA